MAVVDRFYCILVQFIYKASMDPLDQVIEANSDHSQSPYRDPPVACCGSRRINVGSMFAQEPPAQHINATANLLANAERISPYREIPNVFSEAAQQLALDSVRTDEMYHTETHGSNRTLHQQNPSENDVNNLSYNSYMSNPLAEVPQGQRLFADTPQSNSVAHGRTVHNNTQSSSHLLFNQSVHGRQGENTRNAGGRHQGRQLHGASSAPASVDGGKFFNLYNVLILLSLI